MAQEDVSWRQKAEPFTAGERAQMVVALAKAALLAAIVERMLDEDPNIEARWPKVRRLLDGFLAEAAVDGE
jgi:hypothetical protein